MLTHVYMVLLVNMSGSTAALDITLCQDGAVIHGAGEDLNHYPSTIRTGQPYMPDFQPGSLAA